ncbi:granzyme M-like isoform X4 [Agrilus planipennis]|uniref:Granzyme M-like isoform X4 n=1 Tax=Agrilus planipennis TaxID=224129 RepID=A0A7F5RMC9_AGRPL|nr:granzyme M-like isoform X4 [Agrilus planipennis]
MVPLTSYVTIGIFFLFSRIGDSNLSEITPRIINGTFACPGQFPFMVSIQHKKSHKCCGTIIKTKWILTAAHCIICPSIASCPINLSEIRVVYGSVQLYEEGMGENLFVEVDQLIPHEDFEKPDGSLSEHDIGLIKVICDQNDL